MAVTAEFQGSGNVIEIQESDRVLSLQDNRTTVEIAATLVASGNYATATALQDHINDDTAAHAASAISNTPSGNLAATDVQAALNELQTDVDGRAAASHTHVTSDVTSGTFADARISESSVTQHEAALSITESQISDLGSYEPAFGNPGTDGYVLSSTASGTRSWVEMTGGGDLGDLDDVTITSIASGELLKWNGSAWINQTLAEANIVPATGGTFSGTLNTAAIVASGHITASVIKPASDSTTAIKLANASGTAVLTVDTVGTSVTVGGAGTNPYIYLSSGGAFIRGFSTGSINISPSTGILSVVHASGTTTNMFNRWYLANGRIDIYDANPAITTRIYGYGDVLIGRDIDVSRNATVDGTLGVTGASTFSSDIIAGSLPTSDPADGSDKFWVDGSGYIRMST